MFLSSFTLFKSTTAEYLELRDVPFAYGSFISFVLPLTLAT